VIAGYAAALAASYLLGAIPTSYSREGSAGGSTCASTGAEPRRTNVFRILGWKYAVPVGLFDIAKGAIPVMLIGPAVADGEFFPLLCGIFAVVGHVFSVFVRFKGSRRRRHERGRRARDGTARRGVALLVWGLLVWLTGYVSPGPIVAAAVFGAGACDVPARREHLWVYVALAVVII
jgi:glycerol-3-phosphate acyltransferase PlsY